MSSDRAPSRDPRFRNALALAAGVALVVPPVGVAVGSPWLFPLLATALLWPVFWHGLRSHGVGRAWVLCGVWVVIHSAVSIALAHQFPERYEAAAIHGQDYRVEMLHWVETGEGREGDIARFLPQHLLHFFAFSLLALATRGVAGLALGVVLLDYMNAYVGALTVRGDSWTLAFLGWHPWAVSRVAGFLLAAALLARPLPAGESRWRDRRWFLVFALLLFDILLKWSLAPTWQKLLRSLT